MEITRKHRAAVGDNHAPSSVNRQQNSNLGGRLPAILSGNFVQLVCLTYLSVWAISPPLAYGTLFRGMAVVATMGWLALELVQRPETFFRLSLAKGCAVAYIFYSIIVSLLVADVSDIINSFQIYIFLLFLFILESYRRRDIRELRIIFWISVILLSIWLGITLYKLQSMPHLARLLVRSTGIEQEYAQQGVGGYSLVYSALIGIPVCLQLAIGRTYRFGTGRRIVTQWLPRTLLFAVVALGLGVVFYAGYSIGFFLTTLCVVIVLFVRRFTPLSMTALIGATVLGLIFYPLIMDQGIDVIVRAFGSTKHSARVREIIQLLQYNQLEGDLSARMERYSRSINLFLHNPFLGTLIVRDLGKHSAILDHFARYGLFIGAMFAVAVMGIPLRYVRAYSATEGFGIVLAVAVATVGLILLNDIFWGLGYMLFVFFPVAMTYVDESRHCLTIHE